MRIFESGDEQMPSAAVWPAGVSRRHFLQLVGATAALAGVGVGGCFKKPDETIVPWVQQPEQSTPGRPLFYATALPFNGFARGVIAEQHEGRPTKIEGNPDHPASLGGTDVFMQASVLSLYDPDRSRNVLNMGEVTTWGRFYEALAAAMEKHATDGGRGLRILTGTITSPTTAGLLAEILRSYPQSRWHRHDPVGRDNTRAGARLALGRNADLTYAFDQAKVIVSLDSNFLFDDPGSPRYARQFIAGRQVRGGKRTMNRLYVCEATTTITGTMADHRLAVRPSRIEDIARRLAAAVRGGAATTQATGGDPTSRWIAAAAADLLANRRAGLIVAGEYQPPTVHALAHAMNDALGNIGQTTAFIDPVEPDPAGAADSLAALVADMNSGAVQTLLMLGGNPVYDSPAGTNFADALAKVPLNIHLSSHEDQTSDRCQWHLPMAHYLEAWGDVRAFDGTVSLIQPLIAPLFGGRSDIEVLSALLGRPFVTGYETVRNHWRSARGETTAAGGSPARLDPLSGGVTGNPSIGPGPSGDAFESWWETALEKGIIDGTARQPLASISIQREPPGPASAPATGNAALEIVFRPDPTVWDGAGVWANNGWLQECPKPLTKLTWDNAAYISLATAKSLGAADGDLLELSLGSAKVLAAAFALPGQPDGVVTLTLGYGQKPRVGSVILDADGGPRGFNAYALRTNADRWFATGLTATKTGDTYRLATTHQHHAMAPAAPANGQYPAFPVASPHTLESPDEETRLNKERLNRKLVRAATVQQLQHDPQVIQKMEEDAVRRQLQLFDRPPELTSPPELYKWGMTIDLQSCIGCNACVLGCQSENNIPVVGKDQVARQREMHWIRIDSYFISADGGAPDGGTPGGVPDGADEPAAIGHAPGGVAGVDGVKTEIDSKVYHQPVPCMHCENAPCELVCPVEATVHDEEGINNMVYNRCVGTRYCSNNCPYKVRRFNFLQYSDVVSETVAMQKNPQVTVRSRGVMEKCTYCLQRIVNGRIEAEKGNFRLRDGDVKTACQQACPTNAIVFGDLNDTTSNNGRGSLVRQLQSDDEPLAFGILNELTTKPRTKYLARIENPSSSPGTPGEVATREGAAS